MSSYTDDTSTPDTNTAATLWLHAPNLRFPHGFSTRHGGLSRGPHSSLNFDDREDDPATVAHNRAHALRALGFGPERVARLNQVHGTEVVRAKSGLQTADALVTDEGGLPLTVMTADCYPIVLEDPWAGVVGAAHAGWRGTVGRIAAKTVRAMVALGARPERIAAAIGPGICAARYPVGGELARAFQDAGLGEAVVWQAGRPHLDLLAANVAVLAQAGVAGTRVWAAGRCSTEDAFFSYRRDAGRTGRMWAVIGRRENLTRQPGNGPYNE